MPQHQTKKIAGLARNPALDLWSLDECHFQQHGSRCTMWVPPEETDLVVLHAPTRKSVALFGAVNLKGGQMISQFNPLFEAQSFLATVPRFASPPPKPRLNFDGDCPFCRRQAARWRRATGEAVDYLPFQDDTVAKQLPEIPREEFE